MMNITKEIFNAVQNKYDNICEKDVQSIVANKISKLELNDSVEDIISDGIPTFDFISDVENQTRCYFLIEYFWRHNPIWNYIIETIHAVVYGLQLSDIAFRCSEYVDDFGGHVPESADKIKLNLTILNQKLTEIPILIDSHIKKQSAFISGVFAGIIRAHPFHDGNGRTARMIVQFCLRSWNYQYMIIPKVRNDNQWKEALSKAMNYDYVEIQKYFEHRMQKTFLTNNGITK